MIRDSYASCFILGVAWLRAKNHERSVAVLTPVVSSDRLCYVLGRETVTIGECSTSVSLANYSRFKMQS